MGYLQLFLSIKSANRTILVSAAAMASLALLYVAMMPIGKNIAAAVLVPVTPLTASASFLACSACLYSSLSDSQERSRSESLVTSITLGDAHPVRNPIKAAIRINHVVIGVWPSV
jgi:hypothetical protein